MRTTLDEPALAQPAALGPFAALRRHWPEYLMEAALLGCFMISACVFGTLLEHPTSPLNQEIPDVLVRRALMGAAMGLTLVAIVYSPWGQRSGAHLNPAVTLTFFALGKLERWDAIFYVVSQFLGGVAGVIVAALLIGDPLAHGAVNYVVTVPGDEGVPTAFWAEVVICLVMMSAILTASNTRSVTRFTGVIAGMLLALFITVEAPLSGVSLNPARTLGSALPAREWTALWLYFTAPPLAMLLAAGLYRLRHGARGVFCAKLHHGSGHRCIFRCRYGDLHGQ
jgi:aquaporin Z